MRAQPLRVSTSVVVLRMSPRRNSDLSKRPFKLSSPIVLIARFVSNLLLQALTFSEHDSRVTPPLGTRSKSSSRVLSFWKKLLIRPPVMSKS